MKVLYTLAFVLLSFAASAQTLDAAMIAAYYLDDCCEETTGQSTMPAATVAAEPTIEKPGDAMLSAEGVSTPDDAEDVPVGAIAPRAEAAAPAPSTGNDDQLMIDERAHMIAPETGDDSEALLGADDVAITGPNDAGDVPVGGIAPRDESPSFEYSNRNEDQLTADDIIALIESQLGLPVE